MDRPRDKVVLRSILNATREVITKKREARFIGKSGTAVRRGQE